MLTHVRPRGVALIGIAVAVLVLALLPKVAVADPATGRLNPSTPTSPNGVMADPSVLAAAYNSTVVPAVPPAAKPAADGADHTPASVVESRIGTSSIGVDSIIGSDDRYASNPSNWWPASSTVFFTRTVGGNVNRWCTGWLIGANTVITAGHCVHTTGGSSGSWYSASEMTAWPGRYGGNTPYGSCSVNQIYSVAGWSNSGDSNYDYGAMKLNCTVGNTTGTFGFMWTSASQNGTATYNRGYGEDKGFGEQWASYDQIRVTQDRKLFYQHDTTGGNSGGPVYTYSNSACGGPCGVAVHTYGTGGGEPGASNNSGTRIVEPVYNNFLYWRGL